MKAAKKGKQNKKKKVSVSTIILLAILLIGLGVLLYPTVSNWWNTMHQTRAIASYTAAVEELDETDYEALFAQAEQYNEDLRALEFRFADYEVLEDEYYAALDVAGNGIIGYITIPKISVELPVYHGTGDDVLNIAAGHLEGSTLPIGGESTHAVISAHRGLPSAKLFTDLDQLEIGDRFVLTVLNETFTYEIDQILIVEPGQMEALNITEGEDYVTLLTCTPYGINTHRMLVRGTRVANDEAAVEVRADAVKIPAYEVLPALAIPLLFLTLLLLFIFYRRPKDKITVGEITEMSAEHLDKKDESEK